MRKTKAAGAFLFSSFDQLSAANIMATHCANLTFSKDTENS